MWWGSLDFQIAHLDRLTNVVTSRLYRLFGFNSGKLRMDERIDLSMSDPDLVPLLIQVWLVLEVNMWSLISAPLLEDWYGWSSLCSLNKRCIVLFIWASCTLCSWFQENYINYRPSSGGKDDNGMKRLNFIARAAESIGNGDIINVQIRRYRQWQLSQAGCIASCITP